MTFRDIFCQFMSEVTGLPKIHMAELLDASFLLHPVPNGIDIDEEMPENQAHELLFHLRKNKAGIRTWLIEGREEAFRKHGLKFGSF